MATLVQQVRNMLSIRDDDFFDDIDILDYINQSKQEVVNYYIKKDRERKRPLRALDNMRQVQEVDLSSASYTSLFTFFKTNFSFSADIEAIAQVINNDTIPSREIPFGRQLELSLGRLQPTGGEHYYTIKNESGKKGTVSFDLSTLTYPYTPNAYYLRLAIDSSTGTEDEIIDKTLIGTYSSAELLAEAIVNDFASTNFEASYSGGVLTILTKNYTDKFNGDNCLLNLNGVNPSITKTFSLNSFEDNTISLSFVIEDNRLQLERTTAVSDTQTLPQILDSIVSVLNGGSPTNGFVFDDNFSLDTISNGYVASTNGVDSLTITRTKNSAKPLNVSIDTTGGGYILLSEVSSTESELDNYTETIADGINSGVVFDMYVNSQTNTKSEIYYYKKPTSIALGDEVIGDLPNRLKYAILYNACKITHIQESIEDQAQMLKNFQELYNIELQTNEY